MHKSLLLTFDLHKKDNEALEGTIKTVIENNQKSFLTLFTAMIDTDYSRTIVLDDSLEINEVVLTSATKGIAHGVFEDHFYAGCRGMDESDKHNVSLDFSYDNSSIHFDIVIPEPWKPM